MTPSRSPEPPSKPPSHQADAAGKAARPAAPLPIFRTPRENRALMRVSTSLFKRLSFAGVRIVTLAEGEITELHVGLKGTMNQLFLKDLADKTRRGLRGRVEAGRSGGGISYGYDVVRRIGADGSLATGERAIDPAQAAIVRRIFEAFAGGLSPKAIALRLNGEGVPPQRGGRSRTARPALARHRDPRAIRTRGTGILNNELYIGRLVWNRLRYVKDPATGKRVSRLNPEDALGSSRRSRTCGSSTKALWDASRRARRAAALPGGAKAEALLGASPRPPSTVRPADLRVLRRRFVGGRRRDPSRLLDRAQARAPARTSGTMRPAGELWRAWSSA